MAYEYPDYKPGDFNLDWLYKRINELSSRLDGIVEEAVTIANNYTDEKVAEFESQVEALRQEMTQTVSDLQNQYTQFTNIVNARLVFIEDRVNDLQAQLEADIAAVEANTDIKIQANNEYIFEHLEESLAQIKVINYFTGTKYTVQDMFDYLCLLHVENGITYTELAERDITYTELAALNMSYTQLAQNGGSIIPV